MEKIVLIIEDEETVRIGYNAALSEYGWKVIEAPDGDTALKILKSGIDITLILLDLILPDYEGLDLINKAKKDFKNNNTELPPVFILSAHTDTATLEKILDLEITNIIPKPIHPDNLLKICNAYCEKNEGEMLKIFDGLGYKSHIIEHDNHRTYFHKLDNMDIGDKKSDRRTGLYKTTETREKALLKYLQDVENNKKPPVADEPVLIVARKWNSWYPSYFDVDGGSYVILGTESKDGKVYGSIIDPGFKAFSILNSFNIPISCLNSCIITHNHPDHIGGIFELLSVNFVHNSAELSVFCSPSVFPMLSTFSKFIKEFNVITEDIIKPYKSSGGEERRLTATPFITSHINAGQIDDTRGILISSDIFNNPKFSTESTVIILGDTEYDGCAVHPSNGIFDNIRNKLRRLDTKIVVLHLGSAQLKSGTGKHLYIPGVLDILKDIEHYRKSSLPNPAKNKLLVLLSEWGLEHADMTQIKKAIPNPPDYIKDAFDDKNLMIETVEIIKESWDFETLTLMPADSGLIAGIKTGKIFTKTRGFIEPEEVIIKQTPDGLTYE